MRGVGEGRTGGWRPACGGAPRRDGLDTRHIVTRMALRSVRSALRDCGGAGASVTGGGWAQLWRREGGADAAPSGELGGCAPGPGLLQVDRGVTSPLAVESLRAEVAVESLRGEARLSRSSRSFFSSILRRFCAANCASQLEYTLDIHRGTLRPWMKLDRGCSVETRSSASSVQMTTKGRFISTVIKSNTCGAGGSAGGGGG